MISKDDLLAAGFREYPGPNERCISNYYQKTIYGDGQKLYFVNVKWWDFSLYNLITQHNAEFSVLFYKTHTQSFEIKVLDHTLSAQQILDQYAALYELLGAIPDIHNN